ncbi:MAG: CHASE2 domain-containing protein [Verrucomicrobiae bacterium]|nr:CHASE2 domain-containing protein [Verrucomicrobiae bacterium]
MIKPWQKSLRKSLALSLALSAIVGLLGLTKPFRSVDLKIFDTLTRLTADPARIPDNIVLVLIDEASMKQGADHPELGRWPWSRNAFSALIATLKASGARAIVFDILFSEPSAPEKIDNDDRFAAYLGTGNVFIARTEQVRPLDSLSQSATVGHVDVHTDTDGVIRRLRRTGRDQLLFEAVHQTSPSRFPGDDILLRFYAPYAGGWQKRSYPAAALALGGLTLMKQVAASGDEFDPRHVDRALAQMTAKNPPDQADRFRDKIVFVGTIAAGTYDTKASPLSPVEPGVVIQATALANGLNGDFISSLRLAVLPLTFLLSGLILWSHLLFKKIHVELALLLLSVVLILLGGWLLFLCHWWLPLLSPLCGVVMASFTGLALNYAEEARRKREITGMFGRFVSPKVVDRLVENPESLELGGREQVCTVFFSDLAGFTDMSERMTPPELVRVINDYLDEMTRFVFDAEGTIDKYIGDAIMGFFNAPEPQADHAARACAVALASQDRMGELNEEFMEKYGIRLAVRFGIHTGTVVVGQIGSRRRMDYTVLGDSVNLASRLEGANKPYGTNIMISEATLQETGDRFSVRPIDLLRVKGKLKPVRVFELMGHNGRLAPPRETLRTLFTEGFNYYHSRQFAEARAKFELALQAFPSDTLSTVYLERTRVYLENPPPQNWDGVYVLKDK